MKHNPLIANLRPWCIGRMVFDRPAESSLFYEKYQYAGNDININENVSEKTFQRLMKARGRALRTKKRKRFVSYADSVAKGLKNSMVETDHHWLEDEAIPSPYSRIFIHKWADDPDGLFTQDGFILAGTTQLSLTGILDATAVQEVVRKDSEWYRQTTYREDWSIPTERGFCIKGALIGGAPRSNEWVDQTFLLMPGRPATFIVTMRSSLKSVQQYSLLKTVPDLRGRLDGRLLLSKMKVLRKGEREFAGMPAEEVLLSMKEDGVQVFRFYLIAPGTVDDRARPYTEIRLNLGCKPHDGLPPERATSPVGKAGALQAWDTLLDSFRVRPGAI